MWRFGPYEFDPKLLELKHGATRVRIQPLPGKVLAVLLERRGEVVTREELRQLLWPSEVYVDYETGLNTAVRKLRQVLNDDAAKPRYVETIARNGYRFIAAVRAPDGPELPASAAPPAPGPPSAQPDSDYISMEEPPRPRPEPPDVQPVPARRWPVWQLSLLALAAAVLGVLLLGLNRQAAEPEPPVLRTSIQLPVNQSIRVLRGAVVAISPDGQTIAYIAYRGNNEKQVYLRSLSQAEAKPLPIISNGGLRFSRDGKCLLVFQSKGGILRYRLEDGASEVIPWTYEHTAMQMALQGRDIWYGGLPPAGAGPEAPQDVIWRWDGSTARAMPWRGKVAQEWHFPTAHTPDGRYLIATRIRGPSSYDTAAYDVRTGESKLIAEGIRGLRLLPGGQAIFLGPGDALYGSAFDPVKLRLMGSPIPLIAGISVGSWVGINWDVSDNGTLVYVAANKPAETQLVWVDRKGKESPVGLLPGPYQPLDISPDGEKILLLRDAGPDNARALISYDLKRRTSETLSQGSEAGYGAVWGPDSDQFAFDSLSPGDLFYNLFRGRLSRPGSRERLTRDATHGHIPLQWHGKRPLLLFSRAGDPVTNVDVYAMHPAGSSPAGVLSGPQPDRMASVSPDGNWLAFSRSAEVYLIPFDNPAAKPVLVGEGTAPQWSPDGRELFLRRGEQMLAAPFSGGRAGAPVVLFRNSYVPDADQRRYAVHPDGKRFLVARVEQDPAERRRIEVITNWFREVSEKIPAGRR